MGLSLSYALPLTGLLNGLLTSSSETEQEMVSVERILEYSGIQPEVSMQHHNMPASLHYILDGCCVCPRSVMCQPSGQHGLYAGRLP